MPFRSNAVESEKLNSARSNTKRGTKLHGCKQKQNFANNRMNTIWPAWHIFVLVNRQPPGSIDNPVH
jgi:hypothetical protein